MPTNLKFQYRADAGISKAVAEAYKADPTTADISDDFRELLKSLTPEELTEFIATRHLF
ncbi:hypothetical protein ACIQYZ_14790 [Rhodococcus erythropolis]